MENLNEPNKWDEIWDSKPDYYQCQLRDQLYDFIFKYIKPRSYILDLGGGPSRFAHRAKALGHKPFVVDFSTSSFRLLRKHGIAGKVFDIRKWNGERFGGFDYMVCTEFLEHMEDPEIAMKIAGRHKVAAAFFSVPNPTKTEDCEMHVQDFTEESFRELLDKYWNYVEIHQISTYLFAAVEDFKDE